MTCSRPAVWRSSGGVYETRLRRRLWTPAFSWLTARRLPLALMGIPERQREAMLRYPGGMFRRGQTIFEELVAGIPFAVNPFLRVYLYGFYTPTCCPEYLTPAGFARLKAGPLDRLTIHTASVTDHLRRTTADYSRFVLLDHMDWMGPRALADEWEAVRSRPRPGARPFRSPCPMWIIFIPLRWNTAVAGRRSATCFASTGTRRRHCTLATGSTCTAASHRPPAGEGAGGLIRSSNFLNRGRSLLVWPGPSVGAGPALDRIGPSGRDISPKPGRR